MKISRMLEGREKLKDNTAMDAVRSYVDEDIAAVYILDLALSQMEKCEQSRHERERLYGHKLKLLL